MNYRAMALGFLLAATTMLGANAPPLGPLLCAVQNVLQAVG